MERMEPTTEQLRTFYRVVREAVVMSALINYVELGENGLLVVYVGKYDNQGQYTGFYVSITPTGEFTDE
jgi:hypothetical protein